MGARRATSATSWAAVLIVIILVGGVSAFLLERGAGGPQPSETYTVSPSGTSASANSSRLGLEFSLNLNASEAPAGHGVAATVDEVNTMTTPNRVSASSRWPVPGLAVGPCGPLNYPIGVAVLSGNYDASNASSGKALQIYEPGVYNCPLVLAGIASYIFQPSSDNASIYGSCQSGGGECISERVNSTVPFAGYYVGTTFTSFPSGTYTVVAGDEWGDLAILHFEVKGSGA